MVMKYQYKDKFTVENANFDVEVLGCFPGGQQRTIHTKENSYQVLVNGVEFNITESNLEQLLKFNNPAPKESEPEEEKTEKRGRGRPPKKEGE